MPIFRRTGLGALNIDDVLSLDLDSGTAVIGLAQVSFVDAYALTGLACFIASAAGDGLPVKLVLPEEPDVRSWLSRMHLGGVLDAFGVQVEGMLPRVAERDRRDTLIELERFQDSHGSDRLAAFIWDRLEGGADGEVVNQLFEATGELGLNVVEHAASPAGGFVAAQRYKAGTPEEWIIVAVGDVGIGIRESLRPRYGDMEDGQAIRRAVQWNVSRIPDDGRGQGLPGVVDGVRGLGGTVWIRSGDACRRITRSRETTRGVSRLQVRLSVPGCPAGRPGDLGDWRREPPCRQSSSPSSCPAGIRHGS
jgi:hypothetical protein